MVQKLLFSELPHSSLDSYQESKQNYSTLSFRELHKIQRQVLQPTPAYVTDQTAAVASESFTKVTQDSGLDDGLLNGRHAFSAGSQSQAKNKTQVFLPGRKYIFFHALSCCIVHHPTPVLDFLAWCSSTWLSLLVFAI